MMRRHPLAMVVAMVLLNPVPLVFAQLTPGTFGICRNTTRNISLYDPNSGTEAEPSLGIVGGGSSSILWDPNFSNSFIVGGLGFIGRVVIQGDNAARFELITTAIAQPNQMIWGLGGQTLVVADEWTRAFWRLDPVTGSAVPIVNSPPGFFVLLNACALDPNSGDLYAGANQSIWRIPFGTATPQVLASNWFAGGPTSFVTSLTVAPSSSDILATLDGANRVVRIDSTGTFMDIAPPGMIVSPNALEVAPNGDIFVAGAQSTLWRISGGVTSLYANLRTPLGGGGTTGITLADQVFRVNATSIAGGGQLSISSIPPRSTEGWTLLSAQTPPQLGTGSIFGLEPDTLTISLITLFPSPLAGSPFHWTYSSLTPAGQFPNAPFSFPANTLSPGTTLDIACVVRTNNAFIMSPITRQSW